MYKNLSLIALIFSMFFISCKDETTCDNGIKDGDELEIDCGGSCPECMGCNTIEYQAVFSDSFPSNSLDITYIDGSGNEVVERPSSAASWTKKITPSISTSQFRFTVGFNYYFFNGADTFVDLGSTTVRILKNDINTTGDYTLNVCRSTNANYSCSGSSISISKTVQCY